MQIKPRLLTEHSGVNLKSDTLAAHLRAALCYETQCVKSRTSVFDACLVQKNVSLLTVTFGEKALSFHKSRGS